MKQTPTNCEKINEKPEGRVSLEKMFPRIQQALSTFKARSSCVYESYKPIQEKSLKTKRIETDTVKIKKGKENSNVNHSASYATESIHTVAKETLKNTTSKGSHRTSFFLENNQNGKDAYLNIESNNLLESNKEDNQLMSKKSNIFQTRAKNVELKSSLLKIREEIELFIDLNTKESDEIHENAGKLFRDVFDGKRLLGTKWKNKEDIIRKQSEPNQEVERTSSPSFNTIETSKKVKIEGLGKRVRERKRSFEIK